MNVIADIYSARTHRACHAPHCTIPRREAREAREEAREALDEASQYTDRAWDEMRERARDAWNESEELWKELTAGEGEDENIEGYE